jgi:hypothetical protein
MLPGETLVKTLDCYIRMKRRTKFQIRCCCLLTLGVYCLWTYLSGFCCRAKKCGNTKVQFNFHCCSLPFCPRVC